MPYEITCEHWDDQDAYAITQALSKVELKNKENKFLL